MVRKKVSKRQRDQADQQRLRRAELKVQRIESVLYANTPRDGVISDHLEKLGRGERGEYIKQALYERIAREVAGHDMPAGVNSEQYEDIVMRLDDLKNHTDQDDDSAAIDQLRTEIADLRHELDTQAQQFRHERSELRREIDQLRLSGGGEIDEEPVTVLSKDDQRQQVLRDKMKGMKKQFGVL